MSDERDRDLRDILRAERSRGRKQHVDIEAERKFREDKGEIRKIYESGTERDLRQLLKSWKYSEEKIEEAVRVFRAVRAL